MSQCSTVVIVIQCSTVAHEEKVTAERESAGKPSAKKEKGALRLPYSVYPVFWVWVFLGVISMSYHSTMIVRSSFSDLRDER